MHTRTEIQAESKWMVPLAKLTLEVELPSTTFFFFLV